MSMYSSMEEADRKCYDKVRDALFVHFQISSATYIRKLDELSRKPGERWMGCGKRVLKLVGWWTEDCTSVKEIRSRFAADRLVSLGTGPNEGACGRELLLAWMGCRCKMSLHGLSTVPTSWQKAEELLHCSLCQQ